MIDQTNGINQVHTGTFFDVQSKTPKVKMVVGQGNPKVGE
jgi:hypothetical protein